MRAGDVRAALERRPRVRFPHLAGWYRRACDLADARRLQERWPAYRIHGAPGAWTAAHLRSGTVLPPARTLRKLGAAIEADDLARPVRTVNGPTVTIRDAR